MTDQTPTPPPVDVEAVRARGDQRIVRVDGQNETVARVVAHRERVLQDHVDAGWTWESEEWLPDGSVDMVFIRVGGHTVPALLARLASLEAERDELTSVVDELSSKWGRVVADYGNAAARAEEAEARAARADILVTAVQDVLRLWEGHAEQTEVFDAAMGDLQDALARAALAHGGEGL